MLLGHGIHHATGLMRQAVYDADGDGAVDSCVGSGDVTKVGTPANNQVGVWTGDGTIAGLATANSGILVTGGTGIPSIATDVPTAVTIGSAYIYRASGTDVPVADGGSGRSTATEYAVLCGGTTTTGAHQSIASVGTAGQVLTSNGVGALPTFQATAILLNQVGNPSGNTSFAMANKSLAFTWSGAVANGLELEAIGGFTGDVLHIHQHTGNPGATDLVHLESEDADVTTLRIASAATVGLTINKQIESTYAGAPFTVANSTVVTNLNADTVDGNHATAFATASHNHAASEITSGALVHERGGLEADVSGYSGLVKISGGATSAVASTAAGEAMITAANVAAQTALLNAMVGDGGSGGTKGMVPAPGVGDATKFLRGDATWVTRATPVFQRTWDLADLQALETNFAPLEQVNGTNVRKLVRAFDDTTEEYANGKFKVPSDIDTSGTVTFRAYVMAKTAAASKNVALTFGHVAKNDSETYDSAYTDEDSGDKAIDATQDDLTEITWTETVANLAWAADDMVYFRISRYDAPTNDLVGDMYWETFSIEIPRV